MQAAAQRSLDWERRCEAGCGGGRWGRRARQGQSLLGLAVWELEGLPGLEAEGRASV